MKICVNAADSVKDKSKETIPWKEHLSSWFYLSDSLLPRASRVAEPSELPWQSPFIWDDRKPPLLNLDGKQFELDPARAQKKSPERHVTIWHRFVLKRTTVSCFFLCVCFLKKKEMNETSVDRSSLERCLMFGLFAWGCLKPVREGVSHPATMNTCQNV